VLQYVAASFHLPSVSTANSNTVQYTKLYQQYEIPTIPAVVISKVLLLQSKIVTELVSHNKFLSDSSPRLPKYKKKLDRIQITVAYLMSISCSGACLLCPNIKIQQYILFFYCPLIIYSAFFKYFGKNNAQ